MSEIVSLLPIGDDFCGKKKSPSITNEQQIAGLMKERAELLAENTRLKDLLTAKDSQIMQQKSVIEALQNELVYGNFPKQVLQIHYLAFVYSPFDDETGQREIISCTEEVMTLACKEWHTEAAPSYEYANIEGVPNHFKLHLIDMTYHECVYECVSMINLVTKKEYIATEDNTIMERTPLRVIQ